LNLLRLLPFIIASLLMAAHFLRADQQGLMVVSLLVPGLLFIKRKWVTYVIGAFVIMGGLVWIDTASRLYHIRTVFGQSPTRMLIILGAVTLFTLSSLLVFRLGKIRQRYNIKDETAVLSTATFFLTALLLTIVHLKVSIPILLLERFLPGGGWIEIFILATYSAFIAELIIDPRKSAAWRKKIWTLFSIVFFSQLILGLAGFEKFLMTGDLHLPVPAMILAGPIFRGDLTIMIFLFLGSILIIGPAWCSYLCYLGSWDLAASSAKKFPRSLPRWVWPTRIAILIGIILAAFSLRLAGLPMVTATILAIIFGLIGVGLMLFISRRKGLMIQCISYCPIGLVTVLLGKINPFRLKINSRCTNCYQCRAACRYGALYVKDIKNRKPNINCTLCGDCLGQCDDNAIDYHYFHLTPKTSHKLFVILAVALHTLFLGTGRI